MIITRCGRNPTFFSRVISTPPFLLVERQTRSLREVYPEQGRRGRDDVNEKESTKVDLVNLARDFSRRAILIQIRSIHFVLT